MSTDAGRETAGVTTRLIVRYVRTHGGPGAVADLLQAAGEERPVEVLEDERTWSSYAQRVALFDAAADVLDDPRVGEHMGKWILKDKIGLPIRMVLLALGSPKQLFRNAGKASAKFSTVADLTCIEATSTSATLSYVLRQGYAPNVHDCGYAIGLLSQVPVLFGLPEAKIRHPECRLKGADRCLYEVSWAKRRRLAGRRRQIDVLEGELTMMAQRVESLQLVAADIVSARNLDETIEQVASRAGSVVRGSGHMVVMQPFAGGEPIVRSQGLSHAEHEELAAVLVQPQIDEHPNRLVVDLTSGNRRYGRIAVVAPGDDPFFPDEHRMLAAFGALAGSAIAAIVSLETTRVLSELSQSLADITASDEMAQRIADALPLVIGAPVGVVARLDATQEALRFVGVRGFGAEMETALRAIVVRPADTPNFREGIALPEPRLWTRADDDPFISGLLSAFDVEAAMSVPVVARGDVLGYVIAGWHATPPEMFVDELVARMESVASQAATALQNAALLEQTTHQALHDSLTGLPNRVLLDDRLKQAAGRARRDRVGFGVLLVDLDGFKEVNDRLGHRAGDDVLREVATRLARLVRDTDTAARLGGDEFVLVCNEIGPDSVDAVVARVEDAIRRPIELADGTVVQLGASVGVAAVDGAVTDVSSLLARADAAMYEVKRTRPSRAPVLVLD